MTYIPVDVFIECMQTSGIKSKYEYYELHNRGIVPTDLMPKSPALTYKSSYQQTPKWKAYQKAHQQSPKVKAHRKLPEQRAYQKAYRQLPYQKAYHKAYYQRTKKT